MGVVHRFSPDWGSHIPILIKCLELSEGPVLNQPSNVKKKLNV